MKRKKVFVICSVILIVMLLLAVVIPRLKKSQNISELYDFIKVQRMDLSEKIDGTGKVVALEKKDLYSDYAGSVERVNVKAGDSVKKGEILLSISSSVLKDQWQNADSTLKQAELNLKQAQTELATEIALNSISKDNAIRVESAYHKVASSKEQVNQAKQQAEALKLKNDGYYAGDQKLLIRAPFNGQIAWVNINEGDKISTQTLLTTVINPDTLGVEALIDENDISLVEKGQKVTVIGNDSDQSENSGLITEISILGQSSGEIVSFPVRIKITDKPEGLLPGMSVDVNVFASEYPDVLTVPASSISTQKGRNFVNLRKGDRVVQAEVKLGIKQGKYWEVKSGLKAGDQIVVFKPALLSKQSSLSGGPGMGSLRR